MQEKQIKSKDRVRDVAEVFTAKKQVKDMLDLMPNYITNYKYTVLEPSCGNGNFLIEILDRRLIDLRSEFSKAKYSVKN
jgi:type I restriction-modification system DNA methylase subunit